MDEKPEAHELWKERRSFSWVAFLLWMFMALILYFASLGPLLLLQEKEIIKPGNRFLDKYYLPGHWAYEKTPLHTPLGKYFHLWNQTVYDRNGEQLTFPSGLL